MGSFKPKHLIIAGAESLLPGAVGGWKVIARAPWRIALRWLGFRVSAIGVVLQLSFNPQHVPIDANPDTGTASTKILTPKGQS